MIEIPVTDKSYTLYKLTNKYHNHNAMQIDKVKLDMVYLYVGWSGGGRVGVVSCPTRLSYFNIPRTEKYGIAMC